MGDTSTADSFGDPTTDLASCTIDATGVPHLDDLLGGGLVRGALVLVVGPPGSGKTTLAAQIAVAAARADRKALILTAFSEPVTKLVNHLRTLRFFDEALLGKQLQVLSLAQFLPRGLDATADEIRDLVRRGHYSLVVLDGFRGVRDMGGDAQSARRFLYELGSALGLLQTTTVITSEAEPREVALYPESTTADVLVGLHCALSDLRERRHIEVIKVRGLAKLPGLHALTLTAEGAAVYPRLEARVTARADARGMDAEEDAETDGTAATARDFNARASFGLPELDHLLGGGLTCETSTLLLGSPGAGKTLLAVHWALAGINAGEATVYLCFRENRRQLMHSADTFDLGASLRAAIVPGGPFTFVRLAPVELDPDVLADALLGTLDRTGARRLVIDSVGELERAAAEGGAPTRVTGYVAALVEALRARRVTTLAIRESAHLVAPGLDVATDPLAVLAENVLLLQHVSLSDRLHRVLSAPKMRFSAHELQVREFTITSPQGIRVLAPIESDTSVLARITAQQRQAHSAGSE